MTGRRCASLLLALAFVLSAGPARAILYIDINAPGGKRMPVALPNFVMVGGDPALSAALPKAIAEDLAMTALFEVIPSDAYLERIVPGHFTGKPVSFPDWKMIGAEAVVIGKVEASGDRITIEMRLYDSTLGKLMAGRKYTGPSSRFRMMAHRFSNEILYAFTGVRGVFDTEIAFSATPEKGRGKEIYIVGLDGKDLRRITENRSYNLFPRWSPDGNFLSFTSYRTGTPAVYLRNLQDGSERAVVRFGDSKSPGCFSPDGEAIFASVSIDGDSDIYRVRLDNGSYMKIVEGWGIDISPSVSPNGRRMAFVSDRGGSPQVYVKDIGSSGARRVSQAGGYSTSPSWSPAGDRIAFTSLVGGKFSIYTVMPDGSDQRLLASGDGDCADPSYSPDGRYVVYTFEKKGYSVLKIISADGRWGRTLVPGLAGVGSPAWSPRR